MNRKITIAFLMAFIVILLFISYAKADVAPTLDEGLVLYFPFDEAIGQTFVDQSGNNNNGVANNVLLTEGKYGNAMVFNGSRFVNVSDSSQLRGMSELTVAFWAYTYSYSTQYASFFSRWTAGAQRYFLGGYFDGGNLAWYVSDGTNSKGITNTYPSTLNWHFFTFIFNGSNYVHIYLDGIQVKNDTTTIATISNDPASGDTYILKIGKYSTYYYNGLIDDFRMYNRVLTENEITALYENPQPTPTPAQATATPIPQDMATSTIMASILLVIFVITNIIFLGVVNSAMVRFLFALLTLMIGIASLTMGSITFSPYLQMVTVVMSLLCMVLAAKAKG